VTVIVRTAGREHDIFLGRALASIRAQTVPPDAVVLSDDAPNGSHLIEAFGRAELGSIPLLYVPRNPASQPRGNRSLALNRALNSVFSEWVAFLDDDDTWESKFLESTVRCIREKETDATFGGVATQSWVVDEEVRGKRLREVRRRCMNPHLKVLDLVALIGGNQFTINAIVARASAIKQLGGFRSDLEYLEDWEMNVRLATQYNIEIVSKPLACYHKRRSATGASANSLEDAMEAAEVRLRNEWIRSDLMSGRIGIGEINLLSQTHRTGALFRNLVRVRDRIRRIFGQTSA
jgi:glycosyltransferase involved in cell wall biosynthesis